MPPRCDARPLAGWVDPAALFAQWSTRAGDLFWLDAGPDAVAGWSWLGFGAATDEAEALAVPLSAGADRPAWGPFHGGWVGWLGYERGSAAAGAPARHEPLAPQSTWLRAERFVAFDHARGRVWAAAPAARLADWVAECAAEVAAAQGVPPPAAEPITRSAHARHSPHAYAALVERCRDAIAAGDAYQLCLTTRFRVDGDDLDSVAAYLRLRAATPSHHGGFLRIGDVALLSATPERFLHAAGGMLSTSPIKGTRPRHPDPQTDAELARELRTSAKERAENVMIVDLMRNDLSRVCEPGSIRVSRLLEVESYAAVHQLVSTVSGRPVAGTTVGDVVAATFPAGSMTGAPKLSAMTILHELEGGPRGVFAGCFGWVGADGDLDLAMVIRSIVTHPGGAYVGAGGGITWRSDAAAEVAEVAVKAAAPLAALGAALPEAWAQARRAPSGADGAR